MNPVIIVTLFVVGGWAFPFPAEEQIQGSSDGLGNYNYQSVDVSGSRLNEQGQLVDVNGKKVDVKQGDFGYVAPDTKQEISETWQANEKGFKAQGAHLPTPPPIPAEIAASLAEKNVNPPFGPGSLQGRALRFGPFPVFYI